MTSRIQIVCEGRKGGFQAASFLLIEKNSRGGHTEDDNPAKVEDDHAASATEEADWEEDNERSERRFGYDPDREVDVWDEYQAAMQDPMFAY